MRLYQATFTAITLGFILSACGGGSAVSESDQVASQPANQDTVVSSGSETIVIPPPKNGTTSTTDNAAEVTQPETTTPVSTTPVITRPVTTTPVNTSPTTDVQTPAEAYGAATLTSATVSGDNVILSWRQTNDIPQGGYNIAIDGENAKDLGHVTGSTTTVQGLDLTVQHCFTVQARYTQTTPAEYFTSNSRCTDAQQSDNQAPVITGNPSNNVDAGGSYSFTPVASDNDDDNLTFSVTNLPAWAQFNNQTGALTGSPTADDVGNYNNIVISVSDGVDETSLNAFAITVNSDATAAPLTGSISLRWVAPTTRTDGSALSLSEIQGYCIYVGTTRNNLQMVADINQGDMTNYVLDNLDLGDYYVAVSVYDQEDNMSSYSNIVMKTAIN